MCHSCTLLLISRPFQKLTIFSRVLRNVMASAVDASSTRKAGMPDCERRRSADEAYLHSLPTGRSQAARTLVCLCPKLGR